MYLRECIYAPPNESPSVGIKKIFRLRQNFGPFITGFTAYAQLDRIYCTNTIEGEN